MAVIQQPNNNKTLLRSEHIFGRNGQYAHSVITDTSVSRIHAVTYWDGNEWWVKDLSTNGTFINNEKLKKNIPQPIKGGDKLRLANCEQATYTILCTKPPRTHLISRRDPNITIELSHSHCLPNEAQPEITIYPAALGGWICETSDHSFQLKTGDIIGTQEEQWEFVEAVGSTHTLTIDALLNNKKTYQATFYVSQDEEHVSIDITQQSQTSHFHERNQHYLLVILARKKLSDRDKGITENEQGWYAKTQLMQDLGISENTLNIHIYRLRKQFETTDNNLNIDSPIERRKGEIRISWNQITVQGGLPPANTTQTQHLKYANSFQ